MAAIAVDICNTIADLSVVLKKVLSDLDMSKYPHPELTEDFFKNNLWIFMNAEPIRPARVILKDIYKEHQIVYITSRPEEAEHVTHEWLRKNGYPEGPVFFTRDKVSLAKQLGIRLALEDSPEEIRSYREGGVKVLVKAQPYNQEFSHRFQWCEDEFWPLFEATIWGV